MTFEIKKSEWNYNSFFAVDGKTKYVKWKLKNKEGEYDIYFDLRIVDKFPKQCRNIVFNTGIINSYKTINGVLYNYKEDCKLYYKINNVIFKFKIKGFLTKTPYHKPFYLVSFL